MDNKLAVLLPLCFPAWWWSPCSRRSRTCGGCWRGTAQSGCPPACPGSSCTSIAGSHQPGWKHQWWRRKTDFWDVPTEIFFNYRQLGTISGPVTWAWHLVRSAALQDVLQFQNSKNNTWRKNEHWTWLAGCYSHCSFPQYQVLDYIELEKTV